MDFNGIPLCTIKLNGKIYYDWVSHLEIFVGIMDPCNMSMQCIWINLVVLVVVIDVNMVTPVHEDYLVYQKLFSIESVLF